MTHGTGGYRSGCRCEQCKNAEAARKRRNRADNARARTKGVVKLVTQQPAPQIPDEPGPVELGVRARIESMSNSDPGNAAIAIRNAQLCDREDHSALVPQLSRAIGAAFDRMAGPRKKSKSGRLAIVQSYTGTTKAAAQ